MKTLYTATIILEAIPKTYQSILRCVLPLFERDHLLRMSGVSVHPVPKGSFREAVPQRGTRRGVIGKAFLSGLLIASSLFSQDRTVTITGSVADSSSGERIPYATVSVVGTSTGTVADVNGYFILQNVALHGTRLRASAIGYRGKEFGVEYKGEQSIVMILKIPESPMTMPTVEVIGKTSPAIVGSTIITPSQLQNNVGIFKNDVVQYVTQLPGVVTVSGISSQDSVRGGGPDENLVLVDEMQI